MDEEDGAPMEIQCDVCGMRDFYLEGGYYYCKLCNTQSQKTRQFVEEEQEFNATALFRSRVTVLQDRAAPVPTAAERKIYLSNWELYNLVLKAMVDRLVDIGYPPHLKDKVLELYSDYLRRRKALFVSEKHELKSAVSLGDPKQNLYALYGVAPKPRKTWSTSKAEKKREAAAKLADAGGVQSRLKTRLKTKAFAQDYLKLSQTGEKGGRKNKSASLSSKKDRVKEKRTIKTYTSGVKQIQKDINPRLFSSRIPPKRSTYKQYLQQEVFTMRTVLILLFVALREIGCRILFTDVLRMAKDGVLHIDGVATLIHEEELQLLYLKCTDFLRQVKLNIKATDEAINDFCLYMEITDFPLPTFTEFLPKFVEDLKLPREFECLIVQINNLVSQEDVIRKFRYQPQYFPELIILSVITVKLRMLFGMDDVTEKHQSRFARTVNGLIDAAVQKESTSVQASEVEWARLFVMEDWLAYHRQADEIIKQIKSPRFSACYGKISDINVVQDIIDSTSIPFRNSASVIQSCDIISNIFNNVSGLRVSNSHPPVKTIAFNSDTLPREEVIKSYISAYPNVGYRINAIDVLLQDFTKSRIDFVSNPTQYIRILEKSGYSVQVVNGDARNHPNLREDSRSLFLFQPYKAYDDRLGLDADISQSMKYLISLFKPTFSGMDFASIEYYLRTFMEAIGDAYCRLSLSNEFPLAATSI